MPRKPISRKFLLSIVVIGTLWSCSGESATDNYREAYRAKAIRHIFNSRVITADSATAFAFLDAAIYWSFYHKDQAAIAMSLGCLGVSYSNRTPEKSAATKLLFNKAIEIADRHDHAVISSIFTHHLGYYEYKKGNKREALKKMLEANYEMKAYGYERIEDISASLYHLSRVYFAFGNIDRAGHYVDETLKHVAGRDNILLAAYNLHSIIQIRKENFNEAKKSLDAALLVAKRMEDPALVGSIYASLGNFFLEKKEYSAAFPFLTRGYALLEEYSDSWHNRLAVLLKLLEVDIVREEIMRATDRTKQIRDLMRARNIDHPKARSEFYRRMTELYTLKGKPEITVAYYDSLLQTNTEIRETRNSNMLANLEAQVSAEKYMGQLKLIREEEKVRLIKRNGMIGLSTLISVFILFVLFRTRQKQKKERRRFILDKRKAENELNKFRREVKSKNDRIEVFRAQLRQYSENLEKLGSERAEEKLLEQLNATNILTEDDWIEFKKVFKKVYPDFFPGIQAEYKNLTESEIRLLALLKLGLSVREIARVLGILPQSVRKTRQRLMRKLNLDHHKELPGFVAEL